MVDQSDNYMSLTIKDWLVSYHLVIIIWLLNVDNLNYKKPTREKIHSII